MLSRAERAWDSVVEVVDATAVVPIEVTSAVVVAAPPPQPEAAQTARSRAAVRVVSRGFTRLGYRGRCPGYTAR